MKNNQKIALTTVLFAELYILLYIIWIPYASLFYVAKNVLPLYLLVVNDYIELAIPKKIMTILTWFLYGILAIASALIIRQLFLFPGYSPFGGLRLQLLVYASTAIVLIKTLRNKFTNQLSLILTISLIAFISEFWELPHHIMNLQGIWHTWTTKFPFFPYRYIFTMLLRLILLFPLIKLARERVWKPTLLFWIGLCSVIVFLPFWFLPLASPQMKFYRVSHAIWAIGYARGFLK